MKKVLVVSSKPDLHSDYVEKKMVERGISVARFNADELGHRLVVVYDKKGHSVWQTKGKQRFLLFEPENVSSVWYRKPTLTKYDRATQKANVAFAGRETDAYLTDLCVNLFAAGCQWVNHPECNRAANNKLAQLRLARKLGFRTPETIVSNDPQSVKEFANRLRPGKIVYKTLSRPFISETAGSFRSVFTSLVELTPSVLKSIRVTPCLIQEYVEKAYELRVTVVGQQVFTARIFSQDQAATAIDWRRDQHQTKLRQELVTPDALLEDFCLKLVQQLGLIFGAIDLIITPTGEPVFLEINPNGQWLWIETVLGAKISDALIETLTDID